MTCLGAQFTAFKIDYGYYGSSSHEEFTMSNETRMPWCPQTSWKVEIGTTWSQDKDQSWAVCERTSSRQSHGFSLHDETVIAELNELLDDS